MIVILAKTSLNTCDAPEIPYFLQNNMWDSFTFPLNVQHLIWIASSIQSQMDTCTHSEILPMNIAYRYFQVSMLV